MAVQRVRYLDGLRGVAAIVVLFFHSILAFDQGLSVPWFLDGQLMVGVFFVMSGYVLTAAYGATDNSAWFQVFGRLIRLYVPAVAVFILASLITYIFHDVSLRAAQQSGGTILRLWGDHRSFAHIPMDALGMFTGYSDSGILPIRSSLRLDSSVCVPLWTISYELLGSLLILVLMKVKKISYYAWLFLIVCGLGVFGIREIGLFFVGCLLFYVAKSELFFRFSLLTLIFSALTFFIITYFGFDFLQSDFNYYLSGLLPHPSPLNANRSIGGALIVLIVLSCTPIQSILASRAAVFLGDISFSVYLLHWPVVVGVGSAMYVSGIHSVSVISLVCLLLIIPYAIIFSRFVDAFSIRLSRKIAKRSGSRLTAQ